MTGTPIAFTGGTDFWIQFVRTDASTGAPVALSNPRMEVREQAYGEPPGALLYSSLTSPASIVLSQPTSDTVVASIAGALTKNLPDRQIGSWDAYATEVDTGAVILLGSGSFLINPNVTTL